MVGNTVVKVDKSQGPYMDNPTIILERREYSILAAESVKVHYYDVNK